MQMTSYAVRGMTCSHCVAAVEREVSAVAGVVRVAADLETGRVTVHGDGVSEPAVREAVAEAGYEVVEA